MQFFDLRFLAVEFARIEPNMEKIFQLRQWGVLYAVLVVQLLFWVLATNDWQNYVLLPYQVPNGANFTIN